jgi:hypothetical protein
LSTQVDAVSVLLGTSAKAGGPAIHPANSGRVQPCSGTTLFAALRCALRANTPNSDQNQADRLTRADSTRETIAEW